MDLVSTEQIRRRNRTQVLERLIREGPSTRIVLAAQCGLSPASAANMIQDLQRQGLVTVNGIERSKGGRPSLLVEASADAAFFVGADVGEAGVTVGLYDLTFALRDSANTATASAVASVAESAQAIKGGLDVLRQRNREEWKRVGGIGLALPGIVDTQHAAGPTLYAQSIGWPPVAVADLCMHGDIRVTADNGAKAYARAELWRGAVSHQEEAECAVVVLLGRGLGMGILNHGKIMRGLSSSAGELGHMKVTTGGRLCTCGARGCLEALIGGEAILARWVEGGGAPMASEEECVEHILATANKDPLAGELLDETVTYLATGLSNVVNMVNPGLCVIGGWLGQELMKSRGSEIEAKTRQFALRHPAQQVQVAGTELGRNAVALGGALAAFGDFMENLDPAVPVKHARPEASVGH
ncbi:MAG: ROK family protein [Bifidobacteriaceae bacterium]|jgi:predicted NBD/HSP70 family sugar kinase|nr:ROK family protein [Bifidobacteriaceae bacterium]